MNKIGGAYQTVHPDVGLVREMMKHQHAAAKAIGADLERRAVGGERIRPAVPWLGGILRNRSQQIVFAVIEHELETPVGGQGCGSGRSQVGKIWRAVAVENILDIS